MNVTRQDCGVTCTCCSQQSPYFGPRQHDNKHCLTVRQNSSRLMCSQDDPKVSDRPHDATLILLTTQVFHALVTLHTSTCNLHSSTRLQSGTLLVMPAAALRTILMHAPLIAYQQH
jgi:hypothetical protein